MAILARFSRLVRGFLGLFIGPTVLAVAYDLLSAWRGQRNTVNGGGVG